MSIFSILIFLFIFTYTVLGMELFAFKVKYNDDGKLDLIDGSYPDENFNTFHQSFMVVFEIVTGDNWSDKFYKFYRAVSPLTSSIFFISLLVIG